MTLSDLTLGALAEMALGNCDDCRLDDHDPYWSDGYGPCALCSCIESIPRPYLREMMKVEVKT